MDQKLDPPANYAFCTTATIAPTSTNPLCRGQTTTTLVSDNPLVREGAFRHGQLRNVAYSARGGGQNYGYYLSLNRDDQEGTLPNNGFRRYAWRTNFNFLPNPRSLSTRGGLHNRRDAPVKAKIYGYIGGGVGSRSPGMKAYRGQRILRCRARIARTAVENELCTRDDGGPPP